jgi:hypothetical protein
VLSRLFGAGVAAGCGVASLSRDGMSSTDGLVALVAMVAASSVPPTPRIISRSRIICLAAP